MWHINGNNYNKKGETNICFVLFLCCNFANMGIDNTYSPYLRSLVMASMSQLKETTSTNLLYHICESEGLEITDALRVRMIRACKSMVLELDMEKTKTKTKTDIYLIRLKQ